MKQKGKVLQETTMVCSRKKHKRKVIVSEKENANQVKTKDILDGTPGINCQKTEEHIHDECNVSIICIEHKTCENDEEKLNECKTDSNVSKSNEDINDSHNKIDESFEGSNVNGRDSKEESNFHENTHKDEEIMPSANGLKGQDIKQNNLTTILENVKGEEKAIGWSNEEAKVHTDKEFSRIITNTNNNESEKKIKPNNEMAHERKANTPPIVIPNAHGSDYKKETDDSSQDRLFTKRKTKKSSLKTYENVDNKHRPSSSMSDPGSCGSSVRSRKTIPRAKRSFCGISFTKEELEYYLPRKSNFSCHEKALKDAGLDVDDIESNRRRRFKRRVKTEIGDNDVDEKLKTIEEANSKALNENEETPSPVGDETEIKEPEEEQSEMERIKLDKIKKKGKRKNDEFEVKVDHTVLLQYLKYVSEHPDEYLTHKRHVLQQNTSLFNVDPASTIARFGRIFQRGQHGTTDHNFLLEVTRGIKSNYGDSVPWVSASKDKNGPINTKVEAPPQEATVDEKDKTDYEKIKTKLEKWLGTITTAQLLKAKEISLKELGEEDKLQSQWWSTLQPCRYLRQRSHVEL